MPIPKKRHTQATRPAEQMDRDPLTLGELRQMLRDFVNERDWSKYHTPRNLAASVAVEAGELLELFQWLTPDEAADRTHNDPAFRTAVGEEISDVLMYLISLANTINLNLGAAVLAKMKKNRLKYPPEKFKGHYQRPLKT